ncbi:MAG: NADH-quinone oxidoreductase subunit H [Candidatus Thorarchaeota archaeon]|nr:NADH-quinone oxidoreductase subunit H [Candidatus Thorarchaeota archaeon]
MQFDFFEWLSGIPSWLWGILSWLWGVVQWWFFWVWGLFEWVWGLVVVNFWFLFKAVVFPGLIFIVLAIIYSVWFSRKLWGRIQGRRGPFHIGKYGGLQLFADAIKLVSKETIIPDGAKRWMYRLLPSLLLVIVILPFAFVPWDEWWYISDLSVSLVLMFAFVTAVPVIALLAGWISGSKYSLIGGFRAANNQFAAEIPLLISSVGPALLAGSLSIMTISQSQTAIWYVFLLPVSCATFIVSAAATTGLVPFDAPIADSEIIFGWRTEFSGIYFTMTYFAEFAKQFLYSAMTVALFLGGSYGLPFLPGVVNFLIKTLIVMFFFVVVTSSFFRIRQDEIVYHSWRYLLPLSLLNLVVAMLVLAYFPPLASALQGIGG